MNSGSMKFYFKLKTGPFEWMTKSESMCFLKQKTWWSGRFEPNITIHVVIKNITMHVVIKKQFFNISKSTTTFSNKETFSRIFWKILIFGGVTESNYCVQRVNYFDVSTS